ncbi:interferon-stimulated 20 kDa exonuclease-like 2 [Gigaspora margarita]|uniref:Interferon-stimulated 20 kDa exonuclease-like 2 n=1 Tax=Gigaspora margarita TaxID=4874 RepID=A0A8H4ET32_GIGMA|nr:interferon-stimulated 20 kDa exonuclease-like 2 [Gigaspora margarita]
MNQKIFVLLIITLFFNSLVLSDTPVTTCQAYPTAPSSSGGSNEQNSTDILAIDCEFLHFFDPETREDLRKLGLAQVAIVNYNGDVVYDRYVHPDEPERFWNRSRKKDFLKNSNHSFGEVQADVIQIVKGKILVGFAIIRDFQQLQLEHPIQLIRDVSFCQECLRINGHSYSLKDMAEKLLNITIHVNGSDHEGVQDATITMDLFKKLQNYSEQMIPPSDFYLRHKNINFIPTTPICAPPPEAYLAINCMQVLTGPDFKRNRAAAQVTLVNYTATIVNNAAINFTFARELVLEKIENKIIIGWGIYHLIDLLDIDIDHLRLRNIQNLPPYLKKPRSLAGMAEDQLNFEVTNNGTPSSFNLALASMNLYKKYEAEGNKMIPKKRKPKKTTSSLSSTISIFSTTFSTSTILTQFETQASTTCVVCTTGTSITMDRVHCCNIL